MHNNIYFRFLYFKSHFGTEVFIFKSVVIEVFNVFEQYSTIHREHKSFLKEMTQRHLVFDKVAYNHNKTILCSLHHNFFISKQTELATISFQYLAQMNISIHGEVASVTELSWNSNHVTRTAFIFLSFVPIKRLLII